MSTNNGGIQNLICDISDLVHDIGNLLCNNSRGGTSQPTTDVPNGGSCVQTIIQHVLSEFCGGNNAGNIPASQPVTFTPSSPSSGISDIVCDVKEIAYDIVGLIPSGCGNPPDLSDARLKDDIVPLDRLANGLGSLPVPLQGK